MKTKTLAEHKHDNTLWDVPTMCARMPEICKEEGYITPKKGVLIYWVEDQEDEKGSKHLEYLAAGMTAEEMISAAEFFKQLVFRRCGKED